MHSSVTTISELHMKNMNKSSTNTQNERFIGHVIRTIIKALEMGFCEISLGITVVSRRPWQQAWHMAHGFSRPCEWVTSLSWGQLSSLNIDSAIWSRPLRMDCFCSCLCKLYWCRITEDVLLTDRRCEPWEPEQQTWARIWKSNGSLHRNTTKLSDSWGWALTQIIQ